MSLRHKTLLIMGATLIGVIAILIVSVRAVLMNGFANLERREARRNVERALNALNDEITRLGTVAEDWAPWDDTYAFMEDANEGYIQANLSDDTVANLGLNLMLFVRPSGKILYGKAFDLQKTEGAALPERLQEALDADRVLTQHGSPESRVGGIVLLRQGPLLVASRPILNSRREGPIRGALIVGRFLDAAETQRLSEITDLAIDVHRLDDPRLPADLADLSSWARTPVPVRPADRGTVSGYALVRDVSGKPALVLSLNMPRDIYALGRAASFYLILSLVVVGLAIGASVQGLFLDRVILSRLERLNAGIASVGASGDLSVRVPVSGRDELANLAVAINGMLATLQRTQTAQQDAQRRSQESEALLRSVVENIPIGIWVGDRDFRIRLWNAAQEAMTGVSRKRILGQDVLKRFPELSAVGLGELYRRVVETGQPLALNDFPFHDGSTGRPYRYLNIRANPLRDAGGEVTGILVALEDISERKRTEKVQTVAYRVADAANKGTSLEALLRYVRDELGSIIDTRNFYIAIYDAEEDTLLFPYYVDETFPEPGYDTTRSRKAGHGLTEYVMRTGEALLASGGQIVELAAKGEIDIIGSLPSVWLGAPLQSEDRTIGVIAVQSYTNAATYTLEDLWLLQFVSGQLARLIERKRAEEALARSRDFCLTLFDEFPALIWRSDTGGQCNYCNKSWQRYTGRTSGQEIGEGWLEAIHADDRGRFQKVFSEAFASRQPFELEYRLRRHDGQYRWFVGVGRPFQDLDGGFAGYLGSCYEITERKHLEDQLRQAQKMEAIGRLAGGVAHDFNNLLTAITGYASFVRDALPTGNPAQEDIAQVLSAAERATNLTQQLLAFSRRQLIAPSIVNLNETILNLSKMLRRLISEDIELVTIPAPSLSAVKVDAGQVEQVLVNLVVNAGDAMPKGGRLTIETANVMLDAEYARQHVSVIPGDYVMLAVSDTGCGMSEEVKARIFEPFFTTKEPGKGTGLGLATCYGIVKQNGGHIWFYSEPDKGTTFKIYFPRVEATAVEPPAVSEEAPPMREGQTVLLVEDDVSVRSFAARVLRQAGCSVLEASNGAEALAVAGQRGGQPIHLLVTDIIMPQMGGEELARRLKDTNPGLKTIFVSGYTANAIVRRGVLDEGAAFLQKPFTVQVLARKVREVLDSPFAPGT